MPRPRPARPSSFEPTPDSPWLGYVRDVVERHGRVSFADMLKGLGGHGYKADFGSIHAVLGQLHERGEVSRGGPASDPWGWVVSCAAPPSFDPTTQRVFELLRRNCPEGWIYPIVGRRVIGVVIPPGVGVVAALPHLSRTANHSRHADELTQMRRAVVKIATRYSLMISASADRRVGSFGLEIVVSGPFPQKKSSRGSRKSA